MAKEHANDTVQIPATEWEALKQRLADLEHQNRINTESINNSRALILDPKFEALKKDASRPASVRTQEIANRRYPAADGPRFRVCIDTRDEDGKQRVELKELFPVELHAHSDVEAQGRYLQLMGIRKHDYKVVAVPVDRIAQAA